IGDEVERALRLRELECGSNRAEIIAEVRSAGGLDAGEDGGHGEPWVKNAEELLSRGRARGRASAKAVLKSVECCLIARNACHSSWWQSRARAAKRAPLPWLARAAMGFGSRPRSSRCRGS